MSCNTYRSDGGHPDLRGRHVDAPELAAFLGRWGELIAGQIGLVAQGAATIARGGSALDAALLIADAAIRASVIVDPSGRDLAARLLAAEACREAARGRLRFDWDEETYYGPAVAVQAAAPKER